MSEEVGRVLLRKRVAACWKLKLVLAVVLNLVAYTPYILLQRNSFFPITVLPRSVLDQWIPFWDGAVFFYLSLYLFNPLPPLLMVRRQTLMDYVLGIVVISLIADLIFLFWPTAIARPGGSGFNIVYHYLISWDRPTQAFPSLHAAFAIYSALCCQKVFREMALNPMYTCLAWGWAGAIVFSTLVTKQHVFIDILAGSLLGWLGYQVAIVRYHPFILKFVPPS